MSDIRLKLSSLMQLIGYAQTVNAFPNEQLTKAWRDHLLKLSVEAERTYNEAFK